jgi:hypothetical protein
MTDRKAKKWSMNEVGDADQMIAMAERDGVEYVKVVVTIHAFENGYWVSHVDGLPDPPGTDYWLAQLLRDVANGQDAGDRPMPEHSS